MKEFYLNDVDKVGLFLAFILAFSFIGFGTCTLFPIFEAFSEGSKFPYEEIVLLIICYVWGFYVLTVLVSLHFNKYKSIYIDNEAEKFVLKSNKQAFDLPFEYISEIKIIHTHLVPRISLTLVKIRNRENKHYMCAISYFGQFYAAIPEHINKKYEFPWFII